MSTDNASIESPSLSGTLPREFDLLDPPHHSPAPSWSELTCYTGGTTQVSSTHSGSERSLSPGPLPGGFSTQWPPQIFPTARPPMVVPNNATSQGIRSAMAPVTSPSPSMNTLGQQPPTAQSSRRAARLACPIRTTDPYLLLEWYQADAILLWKYCQCLRDENCRLELQHIPCDSRIRALGRDAAAHGHLVNSLTNKLKTQELAIAELISELEYLRARLHNYETASVQ